ncbi:hypothetical protein BFJ63_vAg18985 [Fusarium oxysporum f. sp. narcissi]|uniref:Uncharacterized protein n=1 Tax=Fusarium oxysporum f. sp. narcissi TaxID=451672 RepID=A0A4Q2UWY1_FUSOX|nr:hypothetical protein BFJ63_vAg18985 [Fusarium oxysporum f. sp. narcissi]
MQLQFVSFATILAALFAGANAGCIPVGTGQGNNPIPCKSYPGPTAVGQKVLTGLQTLSAELKSNDLGWKYTFTNLVNYKVNFAVQYWDPKGRMNNWQSFSYEPGQSCPLNTVGQIENIKLTC